MVAISSLCVFLFVFTLRPGTGKKNLADEKIFIYQYFFFSNFHNSSIITRGF